MKNRVALLLIEQCEVLANQVRELYGQSIGEKDYPGDDWDVKVLEVAEKYGFSTTPIRRGDQESITKLIEFFKELGIDTLTDVEAVWKTIQKGEEVAKELKKEDGKTAYAVPIFISAKVIRTDCEFILRGWETQPVNYRCHNPNLLKKYQDTGSIVLNCDGCKHHIGRPKNQEMPKEPKPDVDRSRGVAIPDIPKGGGKRVKKDLNGKLSTQSGANPYSHGAKHFIFERIKAGDKMIDIVEKLKVEYPDVNPMERIKKVTKQTGAKIQGAE